MPQKEDLMTLNDGPVREAEAEQEGDISAYLLRLIDLTAAGEDIRQIHVTNIRDHDTDRWTIAEMRLIGIKAERPVLEQIQKCLSDSVNCNYMVTDERIYFLYGARKDTVNGKLWELQEQLLVL